MSDNQLVDSSAAELMGKIMVVVIIALFLVVLFVFFLNLYAKWFWRHRDSLALRRRRFDFTGGHQEASATMGPRGLDPLALKSLPVTHFDPKDFKEGLECAVCLCELSAGEKARMLPRCNHGFHAQCIDTWFQSHSTCPICRDPVSNASNEVSVGRLLEENPAREEASPNFPTNVLFLGDETGVSTLSSSHLEDVRGHQGLASQEETSSSSSSSLSTAVIRPDLVIDVPRETEEGEREELQKSHPISSRIRAFGRLLIGDNMWVVNPRGSSSLSDAEQVARGQS